jgi:hypothetical protein
MFVKSFFLCAEMYLNRFAKCSAYEEVESFPTARTKQRGNTIG